MKSSGIWLVDASIVALYHYGKKPNSNIIHKTIQASWHGYTRNVIKESNPEHIIIIGKGVAKTIENELKNIVDKNYSVIAQPNAHLSSSKHLNNFKKYYELCF